MSYKYFLSKRLLNVYTKHVLFNISNKNNVFSLKNQFCFINLSTTLKNQKPIYILNSVFASFKEYVILGDFYINKSNFFFSNKYAWKCA